MLTFRHYFIFAPLVLALSHGGCTGRPVPASHDGSAQGHDGALAHLDRGTDQWRPDTLPGPSNTWIAIPPGTFLMGSPPDEPCRLSNEEQHPVTLTRPFEISAFEVTQGAYRALMGDNPSTFAACGSSCPVESVRWSDAAAYCNYLSEKAGRPKCYSCVGKDGKYAKPHDCSVQPLYLPGLTGIDQTIYDCPGYRLPTEAEWEYAYRAGVTAPLYNGSISSCYSDGKAGAIGWYTINSGSNTHEVGLKIPNAWGLYDMAGNVWEWVNDWYQVDLGADQVIDPTGPTAGKAKVLRGGSWTTSAGSTRAAHRNQNVRYKTFGFVGFRVARTLNVGSE